MGKIFQEKGQEIMGAFQSPRLVDAAIMISITKKRKKLFLDIWAVDPETREGICGVGMIEIKPDTQYWLDWLEVKLDPSKFGVSSHRGDP